MAHHATPERLVVPTWKRRPDATQGTAPREAADRDGGGRGCNGAAQYGSPMEWEYVINVERFCLVWRGYEAMNPSGC